MQSKRGSQQLSLPPISRIQQQLQKGQSERSLKVRKMLDELEAEEERRSHLSSRESDNSSRLSLENVPEEYKKCPIWMQEDLVHQDHIHDIIHQNSEELADLKRQLSISKRDVMVHIENIDETVKYTRE